jgi:excisionase family DNA binding protein
MAVSVDEYLTPDQVAALIKVHVMTVYNWLNAGKLRGYKAGDQWRIKQSDVETFLKSNQGD